MAAEKLKEACELLDALRPQGSVQKDRDVFLQVWEKAWKAYVEAARASVEQEGP
jgi:hypothetical protein